MRIPIAVTAWKSDLGVARCDVKALLRTIPSVSVLISIYARFGYALRMLQTISSVFGSCIIIFGAGRDVSRSQVLSLLIAPRGFSLIFGHLPYADMVLA
jgi:hypothetical protein